MKSRNVLAELIKWSLKVKKLNHTLELHSNIIINIKENQNIPTILAKVITPSNTGIKVTNIKYRPGTYSPYWKTVGYASWSSNDNWKPMEG